MKGRLGILTIPYGTCLCCHATRSVQSYTSTNLRRITVPHKMAEKIHKLKMKESAKQRQAKRSYKGPTVITCKRQEFNHAKGQTYSNFTPQQLASGGWKHRKSIGDYFTINGTERNPSINFTNGPPTLESLGINSVVIDALRKTGIIEPTKIQALAIPEMIGGKNVLCAAETGSGKTHAYLVPVLHRLLTHRDAYGGVGDTNRPFALVIAPSRELVDQIQHVCTQLANHLDFRSLSICGGRGTQGILRTRPQELVDILISTPGVFRKMNTNRLFDMSRLLNIVLDEADTLFDDSFSNETVKLISRLNILSEMGVPVKGEHAGVTGTQLALVGATLPTSLRQTMGDIVDMATVETVTTTHLHRLMPHVSQKFIRLHSEDKAEALLKALKANSQKQTPTIVFCNKATTVEYLGFVLRDVGIDHILFHADMSQQKRQGRFKLFQNGETDVIVCTDVASRGLDTLRAQHVINYDFPNFMSDYIHRVGRVGRVSAQGASFVLSFVTHKWDVELLWKIEASARQVTELDNVNANIKRKLKAVAEKKRAQEDMQDMTHV